MRRQSSEPEPCVFPAERFSKKLDELMKEKASLKPGLPSRHPKVTSFLERLRTTVQSALRRTDPECRSVRKCAHVISHWPTVEISQTGVRALMHRAGCQAAEERHVFMMQQSENELGSFIG